MSGKGSTIRHVMEAFNPQSCRVVTFREPTTEEIGHDYLWRVHKALPSKGEIMIFNRSHYEDIIEVRVHNTVLPSIWSQRYKQINDFEQYLSENSIKIIKLYLHIGKDEQKKRLESRMKDLGGKFEKTENFKPFVIIDGQIITGQNPASALVTARKVIEILK